MITPCVPWDATWTCDINCDSPAITGQASTIATEILWALSGRRFGVCPIKIRPCRKTCGDWWQAGWGNYMYPLPALIGGQWFNLTCGTCTDSCSCTELSEAELPGWVDSITEVKLDGAVLDPHAYRVDNNRLLVRTDGGRWPWCQDLSTDDTQPGTWSVTALYGHPVPEAGKLAVGELACEFTKLLSNDGGCRLPRSVKQVTRQGVTIDYQETQKLIDTGKLGLYFVDMFLAAFNPNGLMAPPAVYAVDGPNPRVTTWEAP